jgi:hypothetical protein
LFATFSPWRLAILSFWAGCFCCSRPFRRSQLSSTEIW